MEELARYVDSPHWAWYIVFYFFLGGIAGGAYATAGLLELTGHRYHPAVDLAHLLVQPLVIACGILLVIDLGSPQRFWHMLWDLTESRPAFKLGSPMSFGSWILTAIGALSFLSFVDALGARGELRRGPWRHGGPWRGGRRVLHRGPWGMVLAALAVLSGVMFASYTGLLLTATNQPVWSHSNFIAALFLASGLSTGVAALIVLSGWEGGAGTPAAFAPLARADTFLLALEAVLIVVFLASLGAVTLPFLTSVYGVLLLGGVLVAGVLLPLALHARRRGAHPAPLVPLLVLAGGFLLRVVIVLAPQA
ncbi:MAG: NrfD/PsrC family molybdoenzyme membrane anchor subunit [Gemmatimonadota bacterium]